MTTYAYMQDRNLQTVLWPALVAAYRTASMVARCAEWLVACLPALLIALQVGAKVTVLVAVLAGVVACAAMYPALLVGVFGVWLALMVSSRG